MKYAKRIFTLLMVIGVICCMTAPVYAHSELVVNDANYSIELTENYTIFDPPELSESEVELLCNRVLGNEDVPQDGSFCLTESHMYIRHYYEDKNKQRAVIPQYLIDAYEVISESDSQQTYSVLSATNYEYVISEEGRFRVFYDPNSDYELIEWLAQLTADAYDAIDLYLCTMYDFIQPVVNESGYYDITISDSLSYAGLTTPTDEGYSYITLLQGYLEEFVDDYQKAEVLGVMIHEYMHAILLQAGITETNNSTICFQEGMARAAGIEYEVSYANWEGVCQNIREYIKQLSYSMGMFDDDDYKYGGAVFYVFMYEEYDEWNVISEMVNNYSSSMSIFANLNQTVLQQDMGTLSQAYERFLACVVDPDEIFVLSPTNRISLESGVEIHSWGKPEPFLEIEITDDSSQNLSGTEERLVRYLACDYIKITASNTTSKRVAITVTYTIPAGSHAVAAGSYVVHSSSLDDYVLSTGVVYDNEMYATFTVSLSSNDVVYVAIANGGLSGPLYYSCSISVS